MALDKESAIRLDPSLYLYEDRLEKLLVFYPDWVRVVTDAMLKGIPVVMERNPYLARLHQEINQAVEGLVRSPGAVREIVHRDASNALLNAVPKVFAILQKAEKAAFQLDDAVHRLQETARSGAIPPYKKEILQIRRNLSLYMKALSPMYQSLEVSVPRLASERSALIRLASNLPKGSEERRAILAGLIKKASSPKVQVDIAPGQEEDTIVEYLDIDGDVAFPVEVSVTLSGKDIARVLGVQERVLDNHLDKKRTLSSSELDRVVKMLGRDLQRGAKRALDRIYSGAKVQVMGVADNPYLEYKRTRPDTIEVSFEVDVLAES